MTVDIVAPLLIKLLALLIVFFSFHFRFFWVRTISLILELVPALIVLSFSRYLVVDNFEISEFNIFTTNLSFGGDRLSLIFLLLLALIDLCVSLYSIGYMEHYQNPLKKSFVIIFMKIHFISMYLVVLSQTTIAFLFAWELMAISSVFLIASDIQEMQARRAALIYFVMTQLSVYLLIFGFGSLYLTTNSYDLVPEIDVIQDNQLRWIQILLFLGLGIKAGIMPFHKWLPHAHPVAPSNISAILSSVTVKVAIYAMIRLSVDVFPVDEAFGTFLLISGVLSATFGVIYAYKEEGVKRMLAYSSVENIGILIMGLGLYQIYAANNLDHLATLSLIAVLFHTINHGLFKSLLFMAIGSVVAVTGTRNSDLMGGLIKRMPHTSLNFLIGLLASAGIPPLNGFVSELLLFEAFFGSETLDKPILQGLMIISLSLFALTSALAAAVAVKIYGTQFLALPRSSLAENAHEVSIHTNIPLYILSALCLGLGLLSREVFNYFGFTFEIPHMLFVGTLLLGFYGIAFVAIRLSSPIPSRITETWSCGIPYPSNKMEYTPNGFSEPIVTLFSSFYRTKKVSELNYQDDQQAIAIGGKADIHLIQFFDQFLYFPVAKAVNRVSRFVARSQNDNQSTYLLYIFLTFLALLIYIMGAI